MSELPAVVIDTGSGYTKIGFAEDDEPAFIIPTAIATKKPDCGADSPLYYIGEEALKAGEGYDISFPVKKCQVESWGQMEFIWEQLLNKNLRVNPEDRSFFLTEPTLNAPENRKRTGEVFFEKFKVPGLHFEPEPYLALAASWTKRLIKDRSMTGVVVESGEDLTRVVPVIDGKIPINSTRQIPVGGRDVTRFVQRFLHDVDEDIPVSKFFEIARDIKEKYSYSCPDLAKEFAKYDADRDKWFATHEYMDPVYHDPRKIVVGYERFLGPEILFQPEIEIGRSSPLSVVVDEVIQSCPIDYHRALYHNITLDGGSVMFKDFNRRLQLDLKRIVNLRNYRNIESTGQLPDAEVEVLSHNVQRYGVWFGGSMMASLPESKEKVITKAEYDEKGPSCLMNYDSYTLDLEDGSALKGIVQAVKKGNLSVMKILAENGESLNIKSSNGQTLLHDAAINGHIDVVKYLVEEKGADVNCRDKKGQTPLHFAAMKGHIDIVKYLVEEKGVDVNCRNGDGQFPLHYAAWKGHIDIVKYLIEEKGADVNCKSNSGMTPLMRAACGSLEIVKYLIEKGADIYCKSGEEGTTAVQVAAMKGMTDIVKFFVEEKGIDANCKDDEGFTLLQLAVMFNGDHFALVKYLVEEKGVDVNSENNNGSTSLHALAGGEGNNVFIAKYLVEKGADVNHRDKKGGTPRDIAESVGKNELLAYLTEREQDVVKAAEEEKSEEEKSLQEPDGWKAAILKCGVDEDSANIIVKLFEENEIEISQFYDLTHELLKELGVKMGPRMKIMKYIDEHKNK